MAPVAGCTLVPLHVAQTVRPEFIAARTAAAAAAAVHAEVNESEMLWASSPVHGRFCYAAQHSPFGA